MSGTLADLDTNMPELRGKTTEELLRLIQDYLYQLLESLRWTLNNLGKDNLNEDEYQSIKKELNGDLTLTVTNGETVSTIALNQAGVQISSQNISFSGLVSFQNLKTPGQTVINGGNITTGAINASLITTGHLSANRIQGGTIDGSTFVSRYNGPQDWSGTLQFYYHNQLLAEMRVEEFRNRKYLTLQSYSANDLEVYSDNNLDLKSTQDARITAGGDVQIEPGGGTTISGEPVDINSGTNGTTEIGGNPVNIDSNGNMTIHASNTMTLSADGTFKILDEDGVAWQFTRFGIYRGGHLVFPLP